jgi:hypothetical protein
VVGSSEVIAGRFLSLDWEHTSFATDETTEQSYPPPVKAYRPAILDTC